MDYHYHARLTIVRREELAKQVLEGRLSLKEAMAEFKLSRQTVAKWVRRYRDDGVAGLKDRSSRPHRSPRSTSKEKIMEIEQLRRQRWTGRGSNRAQCDALPGRRCGLVRTTRHHNPTGAHR